MNKGAMRTRREQGKWDRNKKPSLFLITVRISIIIIIYLSVSVSYNSYNNHTTLIPVELGLLGVCGAIYAAVFRRKENIDTQTAFSEAIVLFLNNYFVTICVGLLLSSILSVIFLSEPIPKNEGVVIAQKPNEDAVFSTNPSLADPQEKCHIPLSAWEEDPFFEKRDEYMEYHVTEDALQDILFHELSITVSFIPINGPYDASVLNFSPYGENTKRARQSEEGYLFYCNMERQTGETRKDHQMYLLNDANHYRSEADKYYSVSDNQKMLGGNSVLLGDLHDEFDEKLEYYTEAFGYYQNAYRSAISEGTSLDDLRYIVDQMEFISNKLQTLPMDNCKRTSAPYIVLAFRQLTESFDS